MAGGERIVPSDWSTAIELSSSFLFAFAPTMTESERKASCVGVSLALSLHGYSRLELRGEDAKGHQRSSVKITRCGLPGRVFPDS